jgi:hypothetical protein
MMTRPLSKETRIRAKWLASAFLFTLFRVAAAAQDTTGSQR